MCRFNTVAWNVQLRSLIIWSFILLVQLTEDIHYILENSDSSSSTNHQSSFPSRCDTVKAVMLGQALNQRRVLLRTEATLYWLPVVCSSDAVCTLSLLHLTRSSKIHYFTSDDCASGLPESLWKILDYKRYSEVPVTINLKKGLCTYVA